jgi:hypothetical protein
VLAFPRHIIEAAELFSFVPAAHITLAQVAFAVQQFDFAFAAVSPVDACAFELSWYMDAPQSTVADPHFEGHAAGNFHPFFLKDCAIDSTSRDAPHALQAFVV